MTETPRCARCGQKLDETRDGDLDFAVLCYGCEEIEQMAASRAEEQAEQNARDHRDPYAPDWGWGDE